MSPNVTCDPLASFSPRPTVAKRKEAHELRKTMKPLVEKRRRARINDSLNHLKELILPLTGRDKSRNSKLEKADILEMTVRFLSDIPPVQNKHSTDSYKEGYHACLQRVSALLPKSGLEPDATRQVTDFIQRSMVANVNRQCLNCCGQSSAAHIQQRLLRLKSSLGPKPESALPPGRARSVPRHDSAPMWRPW
ncbi:transcription factor HES-2-like isoform X2 [Hippocampus comes]|uniref:transcription factor HES-2-like isoform X2 n=1 Tax=Hippocampus comes TaxID=109280 RepID=UPI00094EE496|nr:PREDICTED: transcription factor HES-2-like isoform X2 [Hippocampus comes]